MACTGVHRNQAWDCNFRAVNFYTSSSSQLLISQHANTNSVGNCFIVSGCKIYWSNYPSPGWVTDELLCPSANSAALYHWLSHLHSAHASYFSVSPLITLAGMVTLPRGEGRVLQNLRRRVTPGSPTISVYIYKINPTGDWGEDQPLSHFYSHFLALEIFAALLKLDFSIMR